MDRIKKVYRFLRWNLAQVWLRVQPDVDVVGIAGSVGKTSTKEMIAAVLSENFKTVSTLANYDPIFNIPITALRTSNGTKFIAELSIDAVGQMSKYLSLIAPRIGVITRLSLEHTDEAHFGTFEVAINEEAKLLDALPKHGWAILNGDDEIVRNVSFRAKCQKIFYGFDIGNDITITEFASKFVDNNVVTEFSLKIGDATEKFSIGLLGKVSVYSATAAICTGMVMGMSLAAIRQGLSRLKSVPGRLVPIQTKLGVVIDDTYNASPAAVEAAIDLLASLGTNTTLVLGDMRELGDYSAHEHRRIGKYASDAGISKLVTYGDQAALALEEFTGQKCHAVSYQTAFEWMQQNPSAVTLVKGSRGTHMENIVALLKESE